MVRLYGLPLVVLAATLLVSTACGQAPASPTAAPPAATKAVEPTKPAAPAPTTAAAPPQATQAVAAKTNWPQKGKVITIIVPFSSGSNDVMGRLIAAFLEKELGTPVEVVNKPGATTQVGIADLALAKPDGYTLAMTTQPTTILVYMDPDRKSSFSRKDLAPIAGIAVDSQQFGVKGDSPYKTLKDLVDAAKANPGKIKAGDQGLLSPTHLETIMLGKAAGAKFAPVHFNGDADNLAALLGGHIDTMVGGAQPILGPMKAGDVRPLGVTGDKENPFLPGVKTTASQGYDVPMVVSRGLLAPGGTPKEVIDLLNAASRKMTQDADFVKKCEQAGIAVQYMDTAAWAAHWDYWEKTVVPLLAEAKAEEQR